MTNLHTDFDPKIHRGINLTGFPNKRLKKLNFIDSEIKINNYSKIADETLKQLAQLITDFRRVFVVLPHLRPAIPYIEPAIHEITGQPPVIVYLKKNDEGEYIPQFNDMKKFRNRSRDFRAVIRKRIDNLD